MIQNALAWIVIGLLMGWLEIAVLVVKGLQYISQRLYGGHV